MSTMHDLLKRVMREAKIDLVREARDKMNGARALFCISRV